MSRQRETEEEKAARSFAHLLGVLQAGDVNRIVSDEWHKLLDVVSGMASRKERLVAGEMTLKFKIGIDQLQQVAIAFEVKTKEPKEKNPVATAWLDKTGNIVQRNPRQGEFDLRPVENHRRFADNQPARDRRFADVQPRERVDPDTGEVTMEADHG